MFSTLLKVFVPYLLLFGFQLKALQYGPFPLHDAELLFLQRLLSRSLLSPLLYLLYLPLQIPGITVLKQAWQKATAYNARLLVRPAIAVELLDKWPQRETLFAQSLLLQ